MCHDRERGSVTVWVAGLLVLIGLVTLVGVVRGTAVVGRHGAEVAADLAALAGATALSASEPDACAQAAAYAARNGARLTGCVVDGDDVEVEVSRPVRFGRLGARLASARARAGPVDRGSPAQRGVAAESAATPQGD
ncbi:MAG TPA: Rv3654c family TadE-like protein [Mycobacteriales bacterium]